MAIELCSDDDSTSPRISFSHDISHTDTLQVIPSTNYSSSPTSSLDFDFCVCHQTSDLESSSADELFFDGKILPIEMKRKIPLPNKAERAPLAKSHKLVIPRNTNFKNDEILSSSEEKNSKSFWRFKRSNSLNCGSSYARTLCPLPLLSRSNSTGSSTPSVNKHKQHYQKSSSSVSNGHYHHHQKPPLRKIIQSNPYINGIKINSVLNVPPANLFGLSSIFSSAKEKNKKR